MFGKKDNNYWNKHDIEFLQKKVHRLEKKVDLILEELDLEMEEGMRLKDKEDKS